MPAAPTITAIVPARNEEANIACCVRSLAAQPEIGEIIVVNDQSTDCTGKILSELVREIPTLLVRETDCVPPGWLGKANALALGAEAARGEWLLFTDADTTHLPGAAARALADARTHDAALASYSPEQECRTWWEKVLIPFVFCRLSQLYSFDRVNDPQSPDAAANGQFLMIRREVFELVGGPSSVRSEVLEDVALARIVKAASHRIYFAPGHGIVRTRMYTSFRAMWEGWTKNLYLLVGGTRVAVRRELLAVIPWLAILLLFTAKVHPALPWFGLLLLLGRHAFYAGMLHRNRYPLSRILYYVPGMLLYVSVLLASARRYARGSVVWRGREYPVESR